ncbi:DNA topoisomerase VI subunit B, partial [Candidatus Bathyarchaeota archaeon]|nr:DNA topoisomerase VI subunit B [Candidatus Bathyarchaeota archaeon]
MDSNGKVEEAEARSLKVGDHIIAPKRLPAGGSIKEINILDYIDSSDVKWKWMYVYGIEKSVLEDILSKSETIHKKTDKSRRYYRVKVEDGSSIDILDDSMNQYMRKGFLPLNLVLKLGLKCSVRNCVIQTYLHGKVTRIPVIWELTPSLMRFLGLFISEGHVDVRQAGLTFGKHESSLIDEVCRTARTLGCNITVEQRESSIRVKIFGNMIPILMEKWCKRGAANKRIPEFAFRAEESLRQHLLDGLYIGDGHMVKNRNCLMHNTISKGLANDIMYLWLMQGVLASVTQRIQLGLGTKPSTCYSVSVYGKDIEKTHSFSTVREVRTKRLVNSNISAMQLAQSDLCQLKIRKIETINEGFDYVYDLSVPTHENFVGGMGGLSCHNSRGQQGIGISGCVLYAQLTTGEPTIIHSSIGDGKTHKYVLKIDVKTNEPKILEEETTEDGDNKWHGLQITFSAEGLYREHKQGVLEFLKQVAIANPYANIIFDSPNGRMEFKRSANNLPVEAKEIQPHLDGVEVGILSRMLHETKARTCASFFTTEFSRIGKLTAGNICKLAVVDPKTSPRKITQEEVVKLSKATKEVKLTRPPTDCLSPLGNDLVESGLKKELNPEWVSALSRLPSVYRGWPFQIEVGIAYGGSITEPVVMRFANKVPLLYQQGDCAITKAAMAVDWKR